MEMGVGKAVHPTNILIPFFVLQVAHYSLEF